MVQPTIQEIQKTQGTRLSEKAPWETYADELKVNMTPELASAVAEYAERMHETSQTSNQVKEELHRQKELNQEVSKEYQWLTPEEYADQEARIGKPMSHAEFITKLRQNGVTCFYKQHPQPQKAVLYVQRHSTDEPEIACWVQQGIMPELSIMRFDEHGVPLDERRRGWRTCLLQIILKGILTEEKANRIFGKPRITQAFARYNSTLQAFRNNGNSLDE